MIVFLSTNVGSPFPRTVARMSVTQIPRFPDSPVLRKIISTHICHSFQGDELTGHRMATHSSFTVLSIVRLYILIAYCLLSTLSPKTIPEYFFFFQCNTFQEMAFGETGHSGNWLSRKWQKKHKRLEHSFKSPKALKPWVLVQQTYNLNI